MSPDCGGECAHAAQDGGRHCLEPPHHQAVQGQDEGVIGRGLYLRRYKQRGCGSGPFSAESGSSKSEFYKPDPDPTGTSINSNV